MISGCYNEFSFWLSQRGGESSKSIKSDTIRLALLALDWSLGAWMIPLPALRSLRSFPTTRTHSSSSAWMCFPSLTTHRWWFRMMSLCWMMHFHVLESCGLASTSSNSLWQRYFWRSILLQRAPLEFKKCQTRWANAALFCVSMFLTTKPSSITGLVMVAHATDVHPLEWLLPVHRKIACVEESLVVYLLGRMVCPPNIMAVLLGQIARGPCVLPMRG